jgi:hypothetical protein
VDDDAQFVFYENLEQVPEDATPFDMLGADLSHHHGSCSFETFLERYELADPVLWEIAKIVHEADLGDERYDAPEAPGLDLLLRALSMVHEDHDLIMITAPLFDAVYEYRRQAILLGRDPA